MKIVIDTNVVISGVFFGGIPYKILESVRDDKIHISTSIDILDEYKRVGEDLAHEYPENRLYPILDMLFMKSSLCVPADLPKQICEDPDDDKFIACALASKCQIIVSGDKLLQDVKKYQDIKIMKPRKFVDTFLS